MSHFRLYVGCNYECILINLKHIIYGLCMEHKKFLSYACNYTIKAIFNNISLMVVVFVSVLL